MLKTHKRNNSKQKWHWIFPGWTDDIFLTLFAGFNLDLQQLFMVNGGKWIYKGKKKTPSVPWWEITIVVSIFPIQWHNDVIQNLLSVTSPHSTAFTFTSCLIFTLNEANQLKRNYEWGMTLFTKRGMRRISKLASALHRHKSAT